MSTHLEPNHTILLSQVSDMKFPCIWFSGPHKNQRFMFGYSRIRAKWMLLATPFWPAASAYLPGGVLDASGRYYEFIELLGWKPKPNAVPSFLSGALFYLHRIANQFDVKMKKPIQLSPDAFKAKVIDISIGTDFFNTPPRKSNHITMQKLREASSYLECIEWLNWYQMTDGGQVL